MKKKRVKESIAQQQLNRDKAQGTKAKKLKPRQLINEFHRLTKIEQELSKADGINNPRLLAEISEAKSQLGGIEAYQKSSLFGQSKKKGGDSSRWLIKQLKDLGIHETASQRLRLLDVGALSVNYLKEKNWIEARAIDLNNALKIEGVIKKDLLELDNYYDPDGEKTEENKYDIVSLSLVINFEGERAKRGQMLVKAANLLKIGGYLYVVLPKSCIFNSRYLNNERFIEIARDLGFTETTRHHVSNKLVYYLFRLTKRVSQWVNHPKKKIPENDGPGKNNFSIEI